MFCQIMKLRWLQTWLHWQLCNTHKLAIWNNSKLAWARTMAPEFLFLHYQFFPSLQFGPIGTSSSSAQCRIYSSANKAHMQNVVCAGTHESSPFRLIRKQLLLFVRVRPGRSQASAKTQCKTEKLAAAPAWPHYSDWHCFNINNLMRFTLSWSD